MGVTNSITTPNCACLAACTSALLPCLLPSPPSLSLSLSLHLQRDFSFPFYAFSRILGICVNFISSALAATPPNLPTLSLPFSSSISLSLCYHVRVALPFNCFLSHELSFSGRIVFKTEINWQSTLILFLFLTLRGVINMICTSKGNGTGPYASGCLWLWHGKQRLPQCCISKYLSQGKHANLSKLKCCTTNAIRRGIKKVMNGINHCGSV